MASAYFRHYSVRADVQSRYILFAGNADLLPVLREMARSFSNAKCLDAHVCASQAELHEYLQELHV